MTQDIGGFGLRITVIASGTYPAGFVLSAFADDADPFDVPAIPIADVAMGLNGDMVSWSKATVTKITVNVIPGSDDDDNLSILADANRVAKGRTGANDIIQMVAVYPDGETVIATQGRLIEAPPASSVASAGRKKSKAYGFAFEDIVRAG